MDGQKRAALELALADIPEEHRLRWCGTIDPNVPPPLCLLPGWRMVMTACCCMGCANRAVKAAGLTREDWEEWQAAQKDHDDLFDRA